MKITSIVCFLLLLFINPALAISPIDVTVIKEAQEYGKINAQEDLKKFLQPWISYEEKAVHLGDTAERAYIYTAFLLMATDAKEKSLNGQVVTILDSERILTDYTDLLSFSVVLFGDKQEFAQNASAVLTQGKKTIKVYQGNSPTSAERVLTGEGQSLFKGQCYFYFLEKDLTLNAPVILRVTTSDQKVHSFYFDMGKIK